DPLHQLFGGQPKTGLTHEQLQQLVLLTGQPKGGAVGGELKGSPVQGQVPHRQPVGGNIVPPTSQGPHPGGELPHGEGLGEIIVGTGIQTADTVWDLPPGGEQKDGGVYAVLPQGGEDLQPIYAGHHQVQHQTVIQAGQPVVQGVPP